MPSITLTVTTEVAARIAAANEGTPYPKTNAGVKSRLMDYVKSYVKEYERSKDQAAVLKTVTEPANVEVS